MRIQAFWIWRRGNGSGFMVLAVRHLHILSWQNPSKKTMKLTLAEMKMRLCQGCWRSGSLSLWRCVIKYFHSLAIWSKYLLSQHRLSQLYLTESLHPPLHRVTSAALGRAIKQTNCATGGVSVVGISTTLLAGRCRVRIRQRARACTPKHQESTVSQSLGTEGSSLGSEATGHYIWPLICLPRWG